MKKKWLVLMLALSLVISAAWVASAAVVAGEQFLKGGKGTTVTFSAVTPQGFTMSLQGIAAIYPTKPNVKSAVEKPDAYLKKIWLVTDPKALNGYEIFVTGTQGLWSGQGEKLKNFQFSSDKLLGKAQITDSSANITIRNVLPNADRYLLIMVPVLKCPNGAKAWGSYPGYPDGPYMVRNKDNQPQMAVWVNNKTGQIEEPGDEGRQLARQRK